MDKRKLFLILAAVFSCICTFIPYYVVDCDGIVNGVVVEGSSPLMLIKNISGIAMLVTAVFLIIAVLFIKSKIGFVAAAFLNVASSIWGLFVIAETTVTPDMNLDVLRRLDFSFSSMEAIVIKDISKGPAFFFVIFSVVFILVTTFLYYIKKED